jgi:two-component system sensor histidine kinase RegB
VNDLAHSDLELHWLRRVRWGAAVCQLVALAVRPGWGDSFPATLFLVPLVTAGSNVAIGLGAARRLPARTAIAVLLGLDTVLLTVLLGATGGVLNPFTILYLVLITLSALVLGSGSTWVIALLSVVGFASLWWATPASNVHMTGADMRRHLVGMWVAFVLAALTTAFLAAALRRALERREAEVAALRLAQQRHDRLAALSTLAGGAAHELATPLSTIAVVVAEMARRLSPATHPDTELAEDVVTLQAQIARCRGILDEMAAGAGESPGESPRAMTVGELVEQLHDRLEPDLRRRLQVPEVAERLTLSAPPRALTRALENLVRNAADAAPGESPIELDVAVAEDTVDLRVLDRGTGLTPEAQQRAGEPFFTTKGPGGGLGLGVFVSRSLAEALGGSLTLLPRQGGGTAAELRLPRSVRVVPSAS